jgi:hypothetical protein
MVPRLRRRLGHTTAVHRDPGLRIAPVATEQAGTPNVPSRWPEGLASRQSGASLRDPRPADAAPVPLCVRGRCSGARGLGGSRTSVRPASLAHVRRASSRARGVGSTPPRGSHAQGPRA